MNHKVLVQCDHTNVEYFDTSKVLSWSPITWAEIPPSYDIVVESLDSKKNPADESSRRPDNEIGHENVMAKLLATLAATTITKSYDDHLVENKAAQKTNVLATEIRPMLFDVSAADENQWQSIDGVLTYERRIYVPVGLNSTLTSHFHNHPESGYFGVLKTAELIS
jgi:hypothetical protein